MSDPQPAHPTQLGSRYGGRRHPAASRTRRRLRRATRRGVHWAEEIQWLLPITGAVAGVLLALLLGLIGDSPDPSTWTVSVDRARDTLMGWLSIVFAGFSIVLAVASLTIQNVVGRFSLRMLRVYQRDIRDRLVIAQFAMAASYILTEQMQLRSLPGDALTPVAGVGVSVGLLVVSGVAMIWYMTTITDWFRVDRTARRVATMALAAARREARTRHQVGAMPSELPGRPQDAVPVKAPHTGYLADVDALGLLDVAVSSDTEIVIDRPVGSPVVLDEPIGWISGATGSLPSPRDLADAIEVTNARSLDGSADYGIFVLVDMAIMALSPAVNDPNTAVEVIEEMAFMFPKLAGIPLGSYALADETEQRRVVVQGGSLGNRVVMATEQILIYGKDDPAAVRALRRLLDVVSSLDLDANDRRIVEQLAARLPMPVGLVEPGS